MTVFDHVGVVVDDTAVAALLSPRSIYVANIVAHFADQGRPVVTTACALAVAAVTEQLAEADLETLVGVGVTVLDLTALGALETGKLAARSEMRSLAKAHTTQVALELGGWTILTNSPESYDQTGLSLDIVTF